MKKFTFSKTSAVLAIVVVIMLFMIPTLSASASSVDEAVDGVMPTGTVETTTTQGAYISVALDLGGGFSGSDKIIYLSGYGSVTIPPNLYPTQDGFIFVGWSMFMGGGAQYAPGDVITQEGNHRLYAIYTRPTATTTTTAPFVAERYVCKFDSMGGVGGPRSMTSDDQGMLVIPSWAPTKSGYRFLGWARTPGATYPQFYPCGSFPISEDMVLYACWSKITPNNTTSATSNATSPTISSRYPQSIKPDKVNRPTVSKSEQSECVVVYKTNCNLKIPVVQTVTAGESVVIPPIVPSRDGYVFKCWNTKSDGSGINYLSGEEFTVYEDCVLYAVWEKVLLSSDEMFYPVYYEVAVY